MLHSEPGRNQLGKQRDVESKDTLRKEAALSLMQSCVDAGGVEYDNIALLLRQFTENLVVRREDPKKVLAALSSGTPITLSFPEGDRYSNAVLWNPALGDGALDNAFLEGFTHLHHIVAVIGFRPSESLDVQHLPDASQKFAGLDRRFVRSVKGVVAPKDIAFVILKIPGRSFPEELLTDRELDALDSGQAPPVFRGFSFAREYTH